MFYFPKKIENSLQYLQYFIGQIYNDEYRLKEYPDRNLIIKKGLFKEIINDVFGRYTGNVVGDCFEVWHYSSEYWQIREAYKGDIDLEDAITQLYFLNIGLFSPLQMIEEKFYVEYIQGVSSFLKKDYKDYISKMTLISEHFYHIVFENLLKYDFKGRKNIPKVRKAYSNARDWSTKIDQLRKIIKEVPLGEEKSMILDLLYHLFHSLRIIRNFSHHPKYDIQLQSSLIFDILIQCFNGYHKLGKILG